MQLHKLKIFTLICILGIVVNSGYAMSTIFPEIRIWPLLVLASVFSLPTFQAILKRRLSMLNASYIFMILMILTTYVMTVDVHATITYISYIAIITFSFGVVLIYDYDKFFETFSNIMVGITVIALIGHGLVNYTDILNLPMLINTNGVMYGVGYLFFYLTGSPGRNVGIFWEPGLFATYLVVAMCYEMIFRRMKPRLARCLLFSYGVLTTVSLAGYLLLLVVFLAAAIKQVDEIKQGLVKGVMTYLLFSIAVLVILNPAFLTDILLIQEHFVFLRLMDGRMLDESRFLAVTHNLGLFLQSPIVGLGISDVARNIAYVSDTSTSTFIMSVFGILGIQYTFYLLYGILRQKGINVLLKLLMGLIFLGIVNKEPHFTNVFMWCIIFYNLQSTSHCAQKRVNTDVNSTVL